jgi:TPR repeat protein
MKKVIIYISVSLLFQFVGLSHIYARFEEGVAAYNRGDYETAFQEIKPLAEQGHSTAQYNLGVMYSKGRGVTQDYLEAVKWYREAAEQGDALAQFNLGLMYDIGKGVPKTM